MERTLSPYVHLSFYILASYVYIPCSLSHHVSDPKHPSSWVEVVVQECHLLVPQHMTETPSATT
jgi:hypothetical protein